MSIELLSAVPGFLLATLLLPMIIRGARRRRLLDIPDEIRRRHAAPTPRLGGIAIFAAVVITVFGILLWRGFPAAVAPHPGWLALLVAISIVFVTGLVDDVREIGPVGKLIAHTTAALIVVASGFRVDALTFAGDTTILLEYLALPVTVLWIVGVTNAFNIIDGIDGLAGTFALLALTVVLAVAAVLQPSPSLFAPAAAFGATVAFLRYNRSPARIFLGDAGSTTLGFFLSIQLVVSATDELGRTFALVPLAALAYPLLDTAIAVARRWLRGHPISTADGRHIHHQFLSIGLTPRRTVGLLAFLFVGIAAMGVAISFAPPRVVLGLQAAGTVLLFTLGVYGVRSLGYHEFTELASSFLSVVLNARRHVRRKIRGSDLALRVGRAQSLEELRRMLDAAAHDLGMQEITLELGPTPARSPERFNGLKYKLLLRVDSPISWELADGRAGEAILRLSCERPTAFTYLGVERIAAQLAPALQKWFEQNGAATLVPRLDLSVNGVRPPDHSFV